MSKIIQIPSFSPIPEIKTFPRAVIDFFPEQVCVFMAREVSQFESNWLVVVRRGGKMLGSSHGTSQTQTCALRPRGGGGPEPEAAHLR